MLVYRSVTLYPHPVFVATKSRRAWPTTLGQIFAKLGPKINSSTWQNSLAEPEFDLPSLKLT